MPDMVRVGHYVFRKVEHIRAGGFEGVVWKKVVDGVVVRVRKPGFLEKDEFCSGVGDEVREIVLVPPQSLNIEGEQR